MNFKDGGTQSYHCALKCKDHEEALLFRDSHRAVTGKEETTCVPHLIRMTTRKVRTEGKSHEEEEDQEEFHVIHQQN
jgi:hypothetical protein